MQLPEMSVGEVGEMCGRLSRSFWDGGTQLSDLLAFTQHLQSRTSILHLVVRLKLG